LAGRVGALGDDGALDGALDGRGRRKQALADPALADPALLRRCATAGFTLLRNERAALPLDPGTVRSLAVIGPNAVSPVTQGGGSATVPQADVSTPAVALTEALDGQARVTVRP